MSTTVVDEVDVVPAGARVLEAFHDLLPTIARALDVREGFQHLSTVAARIVPHDEANLALLTEDGTRFRLFASTGDGAPEVLCRDDRCILRDPSQPHLFEAVTGHPRAFRPGVSPPVRFEGKLIGVFALLSYVSTRTQRRI